MDFNNILAWIKTNWIIAILVAVVGILIFFPKQIRKLMRGKPKRRRRTVAKTKTITRGRTIPRSVGTKRSGSKGYAAAGGGVIPFKYNKDGSTKKAWQVGGTVAAKSRMSRLRKAR